MNDILDEKSLKILELLRQNAKLTSRQISKKTLIPITTIHNRIKKLEQAGIITGYRAIVDQKKLGKSLTAFIFISVKYFTSDGKRIVQDDLAKHIRRQQGVEEVYIVTGGTDLIAKVRVADIDQLNSFVIRDLRNIEGVENTETVIVLSAIDS